jgi:RimJ/RimL family protein N-acetyltransferase
MTGPREFYSAETLKNGIAVTVRTIRADDRGRLVRAFQQLDRESVYRRFFAFKSELTDADLDHIMPADPDCELGLVVTIGAGSDETIIASGRYIAAGAESSRRTAEVAFIVEEDYHGLGIARLLLAQLANFARAAGISAFEADVLADNKAMLAVFSRCGMPMKTQHDHGVVHVTLSLRPAPG